MRRMKGAAGLLTALLLAFQLSAQTFALANEDNGIKVVPVNFTHNGYSYEIEGVAKSTDGDYQIKSPARLAARKLPSTYDPRSSGEITTVKDQASTGACWAFSALACAEQDLIKKGLENPSAEFSVPALVLSSNSGTATGKDDFSSGGNWLFAASALANGQGLCYEDYEPFLESGTENMIVSENKKSVSEYRLNYVMELSSTTQVKRKIMELGAVSASYFAGNGYMNHNNTAYYDPDASKNTIINHSVTVVGWDDNYSKDNFRYKPANNGAWLVKGSWGADQDNDGFYWVSYDEAEFGQFCCYDFEESCDNTYHYSKMTGYVVNASNDGSVYGANVFTAKADEKLDKAGFMYVGKTGSADYTLSVYTDVSDSDPIGVLETQISGSVSANSGTEAVMSAIRAARGSYQNIYAENTVDPKCSFDFMADVRFIQKHLEYPDDTVEQTEYYMYVSNCRYSTSMCFVNMDFTDIKSGNHIELVMPKNFQTLIRDWKRKADKDFIKLDICVHQNSRVVTSYDYSVISKEEIAEYEEVFG